MEYFCHTPCRPEIILVYLAFLFIHVLEVSMQKIQILFPDPLMESLRKLARIEDKPVSEIVRRAVDREIEQRSGLLLRESRIIPVFPTFNGGKVLTTAADLKSVIYGD